MLKNAVFKLALTGIVGSLSFSTSAAKIDAPAMNKIGPALTHVYRQSQAAPNARSAGRAMGQAGPQQSLYVAPVSADGYVYIDAIATDSARDLVATIETLGGRNISSFGRTVSAQLPAEQLSTLGSSEHLAFARPVMASTDAGLVTSQGDRAMRTNEVRDDLGFDGSNITVGILSDSFSCVPAPLTTTEQDIANGDLPADIKILDDLTDGCIDEGRGMAQLIHDVAPEAALAFHTAFGGQAVFAQGILDLALAGSDVIVDDVIYFTEPMFQDGIIAQAADEVSRLGIPYYSSNGNRARNAFESGYRAIEATLDTTSGTWHDFDKGSETDLLFEVTLDGSLQTNLTFQWDNPNFSVSGAPGAKTDVDVVMFDANGVRVAPCFDEDGNFQFPANGLCQFQFTDGGEPIDGGNGGDAIELVSLVDFVGGSEVQLGFLTESGPAPNFFKFVIFGGGFATSEYEVNTPSGFGHNNAAGAEGVGAAAFFLTEEFIGDPATLQLRASAGEPECIPACLNDFSSAGGTPIIFTTDGTRLVEPEIRLKPGIVGPDGTNTTFFGNDTSRDDDDGDGVFETGEAGEFPNFFGTSAAAPHVAAVAALFIDAENSQVLVEKDNGEVRFRMCKPEDDDDDEGREDGDTSKVKPDQVSERIAQGWLLGPCHRVEPAEVYQMMRDTAQNMSVQASLSTGETVRVFEENVIPGAPTFDFDSGFGFIDAVAAIEAFIDDDDDDEDD